MANYKRLFSSTIWRRGENYYRGWRVSNLDYDQDSDMCEADVSGEDDYHVTIWLDNGEVLDMECDCPYASGGSNCKHMAAVLMEMEENDIFQLSRKNNNIWQSRFLKYGNEYLTKAELSQLDTELSDSLTSMKSSLFDHISDSLKSLTDLF